MAIRKYTATFFLVIASMSYRAIAHKVGTLRQGTIESDVSFVQTTADTHWLEQAFKQHLRLVACPEAVAFKDDWPVGSMLKVTGTAWEKNKTLTISLYPLEKANSTNQINPVFEVNIDPQIKTDEGTFQCARSGFEGTTLLNTTEGGSPFKKADEGFMIVVVRSPAGFQLDVYAHDSTSEKKWTRTSYPVFEVKVEEKVSRLKTFSSSGIKTLKFYVSDNVKTIDEEGCKAIPTVSPSPDYSSGPDNYSNSNPTY